MGRNWMFPADWTACSTTHLAAAGMLAAALCSACGGSDSSDSPAPSAPPLERPPAPPPAPAPAFEAQAIYGGSMTGSSQQDLVVLIDGYGMLWGLYGSGASTDFRPDGLLLGFGPGFSGTRYQTASGLNNNGDASTWKVASIDLALDSSIPSMTGTIVTSVDSRSVSGGPMFGTGDKPEQAATLDAIKGRWEMTAVDGATLLLAIDEAGAIAGTSGNCGVSGALRPSQSGGGLFAVRIEILGQCKGTFVGSGGVFGFALAYSLPGGGTQLLIGAHNGFDPIWLAASGKR